MMRRFGMLILYRNTAAADEEQELFTKLMDSVNRKQPGDIDSPEMLEVKTKIRRAEAKAACRYSGVPDDHIRFLEMPFYETGRAKKDDLTDEDIKRSA
jgi:glucosamine-6-phosphate deaminase